MAKLLLIEDEPGIQDYFKRMVARMGHAFVMAGSGPEGLEALEQNPDVDLIMTDLSMPGEPNGMDLVRELRQCRPATPVVVVSGYPTQERLAECKALGVQDFLTKPFEMTFFNTVVSRLLAGQGGLETVASDQ